MAEQAVAEATIPVTRPTFGAEEEALVAEVLRSGWVTQGPMVARFEGLVAERVGSRHAVAVTSCTTALQAALLAAGIRPGDEVVCPSHTYIATANAVVHVGAVPVFADIDPVTYNVDPDAVADAVTPRTTAILPVHLCQPADIDRIDAIAARHGLAVVEDAAPALGAVWRGTPVGRSTNPVCFSFHPRKVVTTGEGGVITTDDGDLAARLRLLRHHHMSVSDMERHAAARVVVESYDEVGFNFRMSDLQAAVGVAQMGRLDGLLRERDRLAAVYDGELPARVPWLLPPARHADRVNTYQSYIARLTSDAPVGRDELMARLLERGISTRRGVMCAHLEPAYNARFGRLSLPQSERASAETVLLPLFPGMTEKDQERVVAALAALG